MAVWCVCVCVCVFSAPTSLYTPTLDKVEGDVVAVGGK